MVATSPDCAKTKEKTVKKDIKHVGWESGNGVELSANKCCVRLRNFLAKSVSPCPLRGSRSGSVLAAS